MDRRRFLNLLGSGLLLSTAPSTLSAFSAPPAAGAAGTAALLLPLSGASSALGLSMQRAARLAQAQSDGKLILSAFDTGDTAEGAARAATAAVSGGAAVILGPVFGRQMDSVAAAAGGAIPTISFSNSPPPSNRSLFSFGITPSQSVSAILQYARGRGVRRIAVLGSASPWSNQASRAADRLAAEIGLQVSETRLAGTPFDLLASLRAGSGGLPDAALLTGDAVQFASYAPILQSSGVQVLGTMQALDGDNAQASTEGAWLSAPDPAAFAAFAQSLGPDASPGTIAALAYDAVRIASTLSRDGPLSRERLLAATGFPAVTGAVRFLDDGRCVRQLAIVTISGGQIRAVGQEAGL